MLGTLKSVQTSNQLISKAMPLFSIKLQTIKNNDEQKNQEFTPINGKKKKKKKKKKKRKKPMVRIEYNELNPSTLSLSLNR